MRVGHDVRATQLDTKPATGVEGAATGTRVTSVAALRRAYGLRSFRGWSFVAPAALVFLAFVIGPLVAAIYLAFTNWSGIGKASFAGLSNFKQAYYDPGFWHSVIITGIYVGGAVALCFCLGLALAVGLFTRPPGWAIFRVAMFIPVVSPGVAMALFWQMTLAPQPLGLLDTALSSLGLGGLARDWLGDPNLALISVIAVAVWSEVGVPALLILAGMLRLPPELYEAATLDGASISKRLRYITVPLLRPVFAVTLLVLALWAVQVYAIAYVMTGGGPGTATDVSGLYIYNQGFVLGHFGYANALSILIAITMCLIALVGARAVLAGPPEGHRHAGPGSSARRIDDAPGNDEAHLGRAARDMEPYIHRTPMLARL